MNINYEIDEKIQQELQAEDNFNVIRKLYTDVLTNEERELIKKEFQETFTPEELQEIYLQFGKLRKYYYDFARPAIIQTYNKLVFENNNYLDPKFHKNSSVISGNSQDNLEKQALDFFQTELNNIKLAISYAKEEQQWKRIIEIGESLQRFLKIRTYWQDLQEIQNDAILAAKESGERLKEAHLLNQFAELQRLLGKAKEGVDECEESLRIFQQLNNEYGEAKALYTLGYLNRSLGNWEKSAEAFEGSLKLLITIETSQTEDVEEDVAEALDGLGLVYTAQGKLESAKEVLLQSLALKEKLNNRFSISKTISILGKVYIELYLNQNQLDFLMEAKILFEKSLEIKQELQDLQGKGTCLNELGRVHRLMGNYDKALEYFNKSLNAKKQVAYKGNGASDKHGEGLTYMEIGLLYKDRGEKQKAKNAFQKALDYLNFYAPQYEDVSKILQTYI